MIRVTVTYPSTDSSTFDSIESFQAAMGSPKTGEVMADVANYTNITPVMQISEIV